MFCFPLCSVAARPDVQMCSGCACLEELLASGTFDNHARPLHVCQCIRSASPVPGVQVENYIVGAPCGVMDQMASSLGDEQALMAMSCQPAEVEPEVPIPPHLKFWGLDSGHPPPQHPPLLKPVFAPHPPAPPPKPAHLHAPIVIQHSKH